jgi:hypothetical protein
MHIQKLYCQAEGVPIDDQRYSKDHLPLGRIAAKDWSNCRVLDRMILYERRIESSLHKTMHELERQQLVRQFQQQDASEEQSSQAIPKACGTSPSLSTGFEAATRPEEKQVDLKKQSQSMSGEMGVTPYGKGAYDNNSPVGDGQNKANQSQLQVSEPLEGAIKTKSGESERPSLGHLRDKY